MIVSNNASRALRPTGIVHASEACRVFARHNCYAYSATAAEMVDGRRCRLCDKP